MVKGSRGAKIFVQVTIKVDDPDHPGQKLELLVKFKDGQVFSDKDLEDIDTNPLPSFWRPLPDTAQDIYAFVLKKVQATGFAVDESDRLGSAQGTCNPETKQIRIATGPDSQNKTLALLHEFAHGLFHGNDGQQIYQQGEQEAESCAFLIGSVLGIDYPFSRDYLLNWKCDAAELKTSVGRIQKLVRHMINALGLKTPIEHEVDHVS